MWGIGQFWLLNARKSWKLVGLGVLQFFQAIMDPPFFFISNENVKGWGGGRQFKKGKFKSPDTTKPFARATETAVCSVFKSDDANSLCLGLKIKLMRIDTILIWYVIASPNKCTLSCELRIINSSRIFKSIWFYPLYFEQTLLYYTFTVLWNSSVLFLFRISPFIFLRPIFAFWHCLYWV